MLAAVPRVCSNWRFPFAGRTRNSADSCDTIQISPTISRYVPFYLRRATATVAAVRRQTRGKGFSLRNYELVTLFPPTEEEGSEASAVENVTALVTAAGGTVTAVHEWGRRKLAYKINDLVEAIYVMCKVQMEPEKTGDLESAIRLDREIMRHLLVHDEGGEGPVVQPAARESEDDG